MYGRLAPDFAAMTDLPSALRSRLDASTRLWTSATAHVERSPDDCTEKLLLRLRDGRHIESVLMRYMDAADEDEGLLPEAPSGSASGMGRFTACISTQVGCAMGCVFCATGRLGLVRDLDGGECVEQVVHCAVRARSAGGRLGNVVLMGMGEPLANLPATLHLIGTLIDPDGFGISPRRVTVSTVGLVPGILRLASLGRPVRLAVSLHAADDALRGQLVPANRAYPLAAVMSACRQYQERTGRRVTFEYALIRGVNDGTDRARRLAGLVAPLRGHVNLIPFNPFPGSTHQPPTSSGILAFERTLAAEGVGVTVRARRGTEIGAGCGQLTARMAYGLARPSGVRGVARDADAGREP